MGIAHTIGSFFWKHFFSISIITFLLFLGGAGYLRFIINHDYLISFEGSCDPYTESCYEECEDDECTETYHYSIVERHAAETYSLCQTKNITECEAAYECGTSVGYCEIYYCDPEQEGEEVCISLSEDEL